MKNRLIGTWNIIPRNGKCYLVALAISLVIMWLSGGFSEGILAAFVAACLLACLLILPIAFCGGLIERFKNR